MCLIPTFLATACAARTIILGLYGPKWLGAIPVLIPLALSMPFYAVMGLAGPVLWGRGEAYREFRVQALVASLFAIGLILAGRGSLVTVAWTVLAASAGRAVLMTLVALRAIGARGLDVVRCIRGPIVLGVTTAFGVRAVDHTLGVLQVSPEVRLPALVAVGIGCLLAGLRQYPSLLIAEEAIPHFRRIAWIASRLDAQA
jgi:O-antigen/teichoic acid export membrane protein